MMFLHDTNEERSAQSSRSAASLSLNVALVQFGRYEIPRDLDEGSRCVVDTLGFAGIVRDGRFLMLDRVEKKRPEETCGRAANGAMVGP